MTNRKIYLHYAVCWLYSGALLLLLFYKGSRTSHFEFYWLICKVCTRINYANIRVRSYSYFSLHLELLFASRMVSAVEKWTKVLTTIAWLVACNFLLFAHQYLYRAQSFNGISFDFYFPYYEPVRLPAYSIESFAYFISVLDALYFS